MHGSCGPLLAPVALNLSLWLSSNVCIIGIVSSVAINTKRSCVLHYESSNYVYMFALESLPRISQTVSVCGRSILQPTPHATVQVEIAAAQSTTDLECKVEPTLSHGTPAHLISEVGAADVKFSLRDIWELFQLKPGSSNTRSLHR